MSQLIALEWNSSEARVAVASSRGSGVTIEQAFSVDLRSQDADADKSEVDIGARLAAALGARGLGRVDTLVAIGRTNIELRQLSLPPAPDEELPDLVRFQAMREFNEFDEKWLLDFVPLEDAPDQPRTVLAAAIGPDLVAQIQQTCQAAGLKPRRLVLRACAAASLFARSGAALQGKMRLLIDLLSDEADLTVMSDDRVVFMRTTRLGGDPPQPQVLVGEVRRTIAAVQNQLAGRKVDSIVLCGVGPQRAEMAKRIESDLALPTELFDPFQGLQLGGELRAAMPDHPGRFAPLVGLLLAELEHTPHAVDFLHPRRRQEPPKKWKRYVIPAVAVVVLLAGYLVWTQMERASLTDDINTLTMKINQLTPEQKKIEKVQNQVKEIEKWTATDVCWLDELEYLSRKLPSSREVIITKLTLAPGKNIGGGLVSLEGQIQSSANIASMESNLIDATHKVTNKGTSDSVNSSYKTDFKEEVLVSIAPPAKSGTGGAPAKSGTGGAPAAPARSGAGAAPPTTPKTAPATAPRGT